MKLKYYLRGVGIGIIVTTLIFVTAMAFADRGPTRDEIIEEARKLGMVMKDEIDQEDDNSQSDLSGRQPENTSSRQDDGNVFGAFSDESDGNVVFTIASGEHSASVIQRLYDVGLIDNIEAFDDYLEAGDLDSFLQPGEFIIPRGSSYEDVARILITKQEDR